MHEALQNPLLVGLIGFLIGLMSGTDKTDMVGTERELRRIAKRLDDNGAGEPSLQQEVRLLRMELTKHRGGDD